MSRIDGVPPSSGWYPKPPSDKQQKKDKVTLTAAPRFDALNNAQTKQSTQTLFQSRIAIPMYIPPKRVESAAAKKAEGKLIAAPAKGEDAKGGGGFKGKAMFVGKGFSEKQLQQLVRIVKIANDQLKTQKKEKITPQTFVNRMKTLHKDAAQLQSDLKENKASGQKQLAQIIKKGSDLLKTFKGLTPKQKQSMLSPSADKTSALNQFKLLEHNFKQIKDKSLDFIYKKTKKKKDSHPFSMIHVPSGPLVRRTKTTQIAAFYISALPVTNDQYAFFLTELIKSGDVVIEKNGDIFNTQNELLCKTVLSDRLSQLQIKGKGNLISVQPLLGKELHPVVCVTYFGAEAFCVKNGYELLTEEQWQRAAAMDLKNKKKNFFFGCGTDVLDPSYANYSEINYLKKMGNLSTPVGFYNGKNAIVRQGRRYPTKNAISPCGCYDMCGNVSCWTSTGPDKDKSQKITKGGSYADPVKKLTVESQQILKLTEANGFTGFRVAASSLDN